MPLQTWCCDTCRKWITDPGLGIVTWREDSDGRYLDFRIVHKNIDGRRCDPEDKFDSCLEIECFLGPEGLGELLSWASASRAAGTRPHGVADFDGYMELIRRLQLPFYEEARPFFGPATRSWLRSDGSHPDHPDTLEMIALQKHREQ